MGGFAGAINTVVGSGSLLTFPVLLALGYSPYVANVSNTVGIFPGSISGAIGYRAELTGQLGRVVPLCLAAGTGGLVGGLLLLATPDAFGAVVPWLVILAALLMAVQPWIAARAAARRQPDAAPRESRRVLLPLVGLTGVYGGYFGAAQGVILLALLGLLVDDGLQRLNAAKNVVAAVINMVAAILFVLVSPVDPAVAGLLALGSVAGGQAGAVLARHLPAIVLRAVVVVGGLTVGVVLLVRG